MYIPYLRNRVCALKHILWLYYYKDTIKSLVLNPNVHEIISIILAN